MSIVVQANEFAATQTQNRPFVGSNAAAAGRLRAVVAANLFAILFAPDKNSW